MIYVKDVNTIAEFWKKIGFVEISRQSIMDTETVIVAPFGDSNAQFQIWNVDFISKVSPEVASMKASLLCTVDDIEKWHKKLVAITETTSDIMDNGGKKSFNFADPEGNYYAFSEV